MSDDTSKPSILDYAEVELDHSPESGSLGDEEAFIDQNAPKRAGPWAANATTFRPAESRDPEQFKELKDKNAGKDWKDRKVTKRMQRRLLDVETFCSRIGLSGDKTRWALSIVRQLDMSDTKRVPPDGEQATSEETILAIITLVCNKYDVEIRPESGPSDPNDWRVQSYKELRGEIGTSKKTIKELRKRLREHV